MKLSLRFFVVSLMGCLAGCTGMNGQFNCHRIDGKGVGCTSVENVNQLASEGEFATQRVTASNALNNAGGQAGVRWNRYPLSTPNVGEPLRYQDQVMRIWIAPYQDEAGRYVEPSYVAIVVKPSHWVGFSTTAIQHSNQP